MIFADYLWALLVVLIWGVNFVVIKVGLQDIPPMLLGTLRFTCAVIPAIFFVKRPTIPWRWIIAYGLTISLGQFAFLFFAMSMGISAGLASLVLQAQAFFTLIFAAIFFHEKLRITHLLGITTAMIGLSVIGMQSSHSMTLIGFVLTLCAAACWALGNIITKKIGKVDLLGLVVWASLIPPLPFLLLSYYFEGLPKIAMTLNNLSALSLFAISYLAFISTLIGYSIWGRLMAYYPTHQIAPFSLLIPIIGLLSAFIFLKEQLQFWQIIGAILVLLGLAINIFGQKIRHYLLSKYKYAHTQ